MEILSLCLTVKETLWGGRRLIEDYGFVSGGDNAAEAWLLSCHPDGPSYVQNGKYRGKTLEQAIAAEGIGVLGTNNADKADFPVLIKLIDAADKLSVQVHPDNGYARRVENENGKTEAWLILDAAPGAQLVYGVNREVDRPAFAQAVANGTLDTLLNFVSVKAGDVVFIPAGMLHAIGAGILLAEVQQSSNTTYRVFDYNRRDKNGKLRQLHVQKATDVVDLRVPTGSFASMGKRTVRPGGAKTLLTSCAYFSMTKTEVSGTLEDAADDRSFVSLLVLSGEGTLAGNNQTIVLKKGVSIFVPAGTAYTLNGEITLLETGT